MVMATAGLARSASTRAAALRTCGADRNVGMTSSVPVQWNQVGSTRGVPSVQTKANRAGTVETSSRLARSLSSSPRSPWRRSIFPPELGACSLMGQFP